MGWDDAIGVPNINFGQQGTPAEGMHESGCICHGGVGHVREAVPQGVVGTRTFGAGEVDDDSPLARGFLGDDCEAAGNYVAAVCWIKGAHHEARVDLID